MSVAQRVLLLLALTLLHIGQGVGSHHHSHHHHDRQLVVTGRVWCKRCYKSGLRATVPLPAVHVTVICGMIMRRVLTNLTGEYQADLTLYKPSRCLMGVLIASLPHNCTRPVYRNEVRFRASRSRVQNFLFKQVDCHRHKSGHHRPHHKSQHHHHHRMHHDRSALAPSYVSSLRSPPPVQPWPPSNSPSSSAPGAAPSSSAPGAAPLPSPYGQLPFAGASRPESIPSQQNLALPPTVEDYEPDTSPYQDYRPPGECAPPGDSYGYEPYCPPQPPRGLRGLFSKNRI